MGFVRIFGMEYFRGIPQHLREHGYTVHTPLVHPTASISIRAKQILDYLDEQAIDEPVHIVAHSMGGLDARYLASPNGLDQGHRILTITTIGTPHYGTRIASLAWFCGMYRLSILRPIPSVNLHKLDDETQRFYREIRDSEWTGLYELTPIFLKASFNPGILDHPNVHYFSFAGKMVGIDGAPLWAPLALQWAYLRVMEGANDGLVSIDSCKWRQFVRVLPASHQDLIGHLYPRTKIPFNRFDFYRELVEGLGRVERGDLKTLSAQFSDPVDTAHGTNFTGPRSPEGSGSQDEASNGL